MPRSKSILLSSLMLLANFLINSNANFSEAPFFTNAPQCKEPKNNSVHVAMTLDEAYLRGSVAAILSIIHHSTCPENLHFHFIYSQNKEGQETHLKSIISHSFSYLLFNMYPFDEEIVKGRISTSLRQALDRPLNYARSYLASMFPEWVQRVVYLDSDVIVVDDIGELYETEFVDDDSVIAAPEYCGTDISRYFTPSFWSNPMLALTFQNRRSKACYFNTGVMVVDLKRWREKDYTNSIEEWMELQKRVRIYELGSLPPFLLVFAGDVTRVEPKWNQHGLGGDNYEGQCRWLHPGPTSLMHWSGRGKPWVRLDQGRPCTVDALWAPFDMFIKSNSESLYA